VSSSTLSVTLANEQDEIDAIGSARSEGDSPHNGVLTSLLNEMDGIEELSNVIVVGATNRPDVLVRFPLSSITITDGRIRL
jgi:SpoVK/Ycf46/Vps4 family AAA+-type ATPase